MYASINVQCAVDINMYIENKHPCLCSSDIELKNQRKLYGTFLLQLDTI